jgi:sensor histidine kinase YesM
MDYSSEIISISPHKNGVLLFVLGILFVLTIYHFLLYFQHKSKTYIYYAFYTLLLFLAYFTFTKNDFLGVLTTSIKPFFKLTHEFWVWLYNLAYYQFAFSFLNFKKHHKKETKIINYILLFLLILGLTGFATSIFSENSNFLATVYLFIYIPIIILLTLYCFYLIYKTPEKAKYYIFTGSFILFLSSVLTILIVELQVFTKNQEIGFLVFYVGIIIENMFFSLGLGFRQKEILFERDETKSKLIQKLQENKNLKGKVNVQLQEKINVLSEQIILKEELEELKSNAFRSQMNPHFIFNALNSIKLYIINNEPKKAAHYLNKFSKLIRRILEASNLKESSLFEELETMDLYMTIENIRFSDEIIFQIIVDKNINLKTIKVPPLVLQPFLENALWHGLSSKKNNKKITLYIKKIEQYFVQIIIEDNGIGRTASAKIKSEKLINRKSIGIDLTKNRLAIFEKGLKNKFTIFYEDVIINKIVDGTRVTLNIPIV